MPQKYKLTFRPESTSIEVLENTTLMEALKEAGIFLDAPCGGRGTCGKCLVKISENGSDWTEVRACQTKVKRSLLVDTENSPKNHRILTSSSIRQVPFHPSFSRVPDKEPYYMAAFDIGTTTIAAYLLDGRTGKELCTASSLNPQAAYGADVISRANYVLEHGHKELSDCVHSAADKLIGQLAQSAGIQREDIYLLCFVGNTCMHHIFFQYPMESLVRAPYVPSQKGLIRKKAAEFDIHIHPEGELIFLPVIAGFVGADTMGCILSLRPDLQEEISLMLDIGTNGELVLGNKNQLVCCSTAAGPAFEGAKIHCGMRGAQGAIDHMSYDSSGFHFSVIGQKAPKGICGSGLIDTIACLRRTGLIDESGRLLNRDEAAALDLAFAPHMTQRDHMPAFLYDPAYPEVFLTQKDVREVQLAKAAIAAGILLLEKHLGIAHENIRKVYIAGAFGNYMDPKSACDIGLLPYSLRDRVVPVGNAAGEGAKIALQNAEELDKTVQLMHQVDFLELAALPQFQDCFIDELEFPEIQPEN